MLGIVKEHLGITCLFQRKTHQNIIFTKFVPNVTGNIFERL